MSKPKNIYDLMIIGAGVAGVFTTYRLSEQNNLKICLVEFGRKPKKRKLQLSGYLGSSFQSAGRLYRSNSQSVENICGPENIKQAEEFVYSVLEAHGTIEQEENKQPNNQVKNKLNDLGYSLELNDYIQWYPSNFHLLSDTTAAAFENNPLIDDCFDNQVYKIAKGRNYFTVETELGKMYSKNILLSTGRAGWRFAKDIFYQLNLVKEDDYCSFGFKGEISTSYLKDWNHSHCTIAKDNITIGPLSWNGSQVPEDHGDIVLANFRENEARWHSEKVHFSIYMKSKFEGKGIEQLERLSKLAYILGDNRVYKGKVKEYLGGNFDLRHVPEYFWVKEQMNELNKLIPAFTEKASFYVPDIHLSIPNININKDFSTDVKGLYIAGEVSGVHGLLSAMLSGTVVAQNIIKNL